jgi:hypothetical protein
MSGLCLARQRLEGLAIEEYALRAILRRWQCCRRAPTGLVRK